ncbi:YebC/PmpR family DNA-binding transcriptional regulator [Candidatus Falkowbacteria bacterium]|jgi:YebC/PmpR family DNA-binding regulatory protein|nr:YebC/PmpR family DNA-binding transcriptional regulator [Candidatus Falkowbacteria bacterium]MBT4433258.1 YebC/PmpR family DNA-binding transcriptional regulator [Candidatus Falkowbacteria bacterium]
MSGHSKWSTIKRQKGAADQKRGAIFTKMAKNITVAARDGGGDPDTNFKLKVAIDKARSVNTPKDNIERAIKKGTGELKGDTIEEIVYEAFGPSNSFFVVEALTDNKNRSVSEIRHIFSKAGGSLGGPNSVMWQFERKGVIRIEDYKNKIKDKDELELELIDFGLEDIIIEENDLIIYTKVENFQKTREELDKKNIIVNYAELEYVPKEEKEITDNKEKEKFQKLFEALDDNDDVNNFYTNADIEL